MGLTSLLLHLSLLGVSGLLELLSTLPACLGQEGLQETGGAGLIVMGDTPPAPPKVKTQIMKGMGECLQLWSWAWWRWAWWLLGAGGKQGDPHQHTQPLEHHQPQVWLCFCLSLARSWS